jgi:hypothetical protein
MPPLVFLPQQRGLLDAALSRDTTAEDGTNQGVNL